MKIDVRNPRSGEVDTWIDAPTAQELVGIAATVRSAQPAWEAQGLQARIHAMTAWRDALGAHRDEIIAALVHDTGRLAESALEVDAIMRSIDRWCGLAPSLIDPEPPRPSSMPIVDVAQGLRPYQLAGVISPWNFPFLLSLIDAIPALLTGCAVIVKPSEIAPRFIGPVQRSIDDVPPLARVMTYVAGAGETGAALVDLADVVCFTGSVPTGRTVGERAAKRFIPAFLELGGKDPAIVLSTADLDRATSAIVWGSTANAGQSCLSIERVYVDAKIADAFVEQLVAKARAVRLAAPEPQDGEIGPIIAEKQIAVIEEHLTDARNRGAVVHCGGEIEVIGGGSYIRPTVLTNVDHSMKVMTEETFGPIIPVMRFNGTDEAVRLANDSTFGLSAAVFAGTAEEAMDVGSRLDSGGVSINDAALTALVYDGEKNSFNMSGLGGSRMGPAAMRRFARRQAFLIGTSPGADPWWFPQLQG
ncbi:MAG: aldehyde dehydrogenase family protein [Actinobacteria bacterium]|nr:aldehyde dehydrogenase family protein [Actinomycetota bacterium]